VIDSSSSIVDCTLCDDVTVDDNNDHIYLHLYVLSVCVQCDDDDYDG